MGFWESSVEDSRKVLFLKYDNLKEDVITHVKKIADFIGMPFSEKELKHGFVEQIASYVALKISRVLKLIRQLTVTVSIR